MLPQLYELERRTYTQAAPVLEEIYWTLRDSGWGWADAIETIRDGFQCLRLDMKVRKGLKRDLALWERHLRRSHPNWPTPSQGRRYVENARARVAKVVDLRGKNAKPTRKVTNWSVPLAEN